MPGGRKAKTQGRHSGHELALLNEVFPTLDKGAVDLVEEFQGVLIPGADHGLSVADDPALELADGYFPIEVGLQLCAHQR